MLVTGDRLQLVRDLLIKLVIIRTALSKQRNINLVVLEKLAFSGASAIWVGKYSAVESIELCVLSYCHADRVQQRRSTIPLSGNDI